MNFDGKSPEPSHEPLDEAFFAGEPKASAPHGTVSDVLHDEPVVPTRPSGVSVTSSADDELTNVPDLSPDFDEDAVLGRKRGLHVGAFFVVLVAAIAGGVAGYYALKQSGVKDAPASAASASASAKVVAAPTNSAPAAVAVVSAEPSAKTDKAAGKTASKAGTSGFVGPNSGAAPGGAAGPGEVVGKGELTAGEISGVVERNRPLIRRQCWQPELAARQGMGGSARVDTSFTIGTSGAVQTVSAHGSEADYPGLASCIAGRIKTWAFPASASSTPVNVPFVFAAQ